MTMNSKVVWKDAPALGLSVRIMDRNGNEHGVLGLGAVDVDARLDGQVVLSLAAVTPDGKAFLDLVRSGDIR